MIATPDTHEPWPEADPTQLERDTFELVVQVNGKVRDRFEVDAELSEDEIVARAKESPRVQAQLGGRPDQSAARLRRPAQWPRRIEGRQVGWRLLAERQGRGRTTRPRAGGQSFRAVPGRDHQPIGEGAQQGQAVGGDRPESHPRLDDRGVRQTGRKTGRGGEQAAESARGDAVVEARVFPGGAEHHPGRREGQQVGPVIG